VFTACGIKYRRCCLLVTSVRWNLEVPPHPGDQQTASSVLYTTSCKHSLVRNYRPKRVEQIEIVNKIIIVASSRLFILSLAIFNN